jgi:protein-disulfide isomerase
VDYQRIEGANHIRIFEESELFRRRRRVDKRNISLMLLVNGVPSSLRTSEVTLARVEQAYDLAYTEAKAKIDAGAAVEDVYRLSLLEADASIQPIRIGAGAVNGARPESAPSVLDDAPLIDPRAKLGGYRLGPEKARITIHLYCDFSARFRACSETRAQLELVREYFPGLVRMFFHHMLPDGLDDKEQERLLVVHAAAACAERQGAFEAFYQRVYRMPRTRNRRRGFDDRARLALLFKSLDVDHEQMKACMDDPATARQVLQAVRDARDAGIVDSPTVVVGERVYPGSKTFDEVIRLIDIELMPGLLERLAPSPNGSPDWLQELPL